LTVEELWSIAVTRQVGTIVKARFEDGEGPQDLVDLLEAARGQDPERWKFAVQIRGQEVWIVRKGNLPELRLDGAYKPLDEEGP
jgi:hypothetical protein